MRHRPHGHPPGRQGFTRLVLAPALVLVCGVLFFKGGFAAAVDRGTTGQEASRVRSDKLIEKRVGGQKVRFLYDNVFIDRDTLTAAADTVEDHVDEDYYLLYGHVVLTSHGTVLHCRRALYYKTTGEGDFSGDVRLIDGDVTGTSLRGELRGNGRYLRLIDQAKMSGPDYVVYADTIYQDRDTDLSLALGHVRLEKAQATRAVPRDSLGAVVTDSVGVDSMIITPDSLMVSVDSLATHPDSLVTAETDSIWTLDCQRAVFQGNGEDSDFFGSVRFVDGDMIGTGQKAWSRQGGKLFRLIGQALLVTPDYSIRADTIARNTDTGMGEAMGHVSLVEPGARNLVTGEHAIFDREAGTALVDSMPALTSREDAGGPLTSRSGWMRFYKDEDKVVMVDSVRIHQEDTHARADTAIAYGQERMVLTGAPEVRIGNTNRLVGNNIEFEYEQGNLRRMILKGAARMEDSTPDSLAAIYKGLPPLDVIAGDTIKIDFSEGNIQRTVVVGGASSHYTPADIRDEIATNDVAGDTVIIHFRSDRVRKVEVSGNVEGTYRFAKIADMEQRRQRRSRRDSLGAATDSTLLAAVDSVVVDTLSTAGKDSIGPDQLDFNGSVEVVKYKGDEVVFELDDESMEIFGNGELDYGTMVHTANHIILNTTNRELYSEGQPYLKDGDAVVGDLMGYNFEYKTGAVKNGVTSFDGYYYVGDSIRRYPDGTMKINGGKMTSCDRAEPHYHFWSKDMKMRQGDKVVAAPIVLKIGHVPVFALPFYFKSLKSGRQSGILFPSFDFGWSSREGRYIRDFGYYWAANDYFDFIFEGDYNEHQDFSYRVSNRYVKRYSFNGTIDYSRQIGLRGDGDTREWQLRWSHNQPNLLDDYKFRADVRMSSRSLSNNDLTSSVRRDIVSGQMKSTVYLSRNWSFLSASLNASRDGRVNAEDDDPATDNLVYSTTLPSMSLNFRQFTLMGALRGGQKGNFLGNLLRNTYVQHSYSLSSDKKVYELKSSQKYHLNGKGSVSVRPPRVGIFNVSFAASMGEDWSQETTTGQEWVTDSDTTGFFDSIYERTEDSRPNLSFSSTLGTTLYGLFPVRVGRLRALRHTSKFSASWKLAPTIVDKQRRSTSVSLSWGNRVDLKYAAGADSNAVEKKLDGFIDWNLATNYNPEKSVGTRWGDISSNLSIKPGQSRYLQLKVSNTIDPKKLALKTTRFNYNLSFNGKLDLGVVTLAEDDKKNDALARLGEAGDQKKKAPQGKANDPFAGDKDSPFANYAQKEQRNKTGPGKDQTEGGRYLPFKINTSISYSYTNATKAKRANANFSISANLTQYWEFRYDTSFDLDVGSPVRQQFSLNRDLHCWALEFSRTVSDVDSQFGFRLYLKAIPALKFVRGREANFNSLGGGFSQGGF